MRRDEALLLDMLIAARKIRRYTADLTLEAFKANEMVQSAVIREFQVIGEAARMITAETKANNPAIDWPGMIGMRNRLVHEYFAIRLDVVWHIINTEIPPLITAIEPLIPDYP
jgi:uncharacterized protein with HEPN domain